MELIFVSPPKPYTINKDHLLIVKEHIIILYNNAENL